tara:strand:- start:141 stop:473 length:333 start_codon:yes stop_codon:yes gene_type:complete
MIDNNSPLRYMNRDVSMHIYETYFPDKLAKEWKRLTLDQLKHHYNIFTKNDTGYLLMNYKSATPYYSKRNINPTVLLKYIKYKTNCKNIIIQQDKKNIIIQQDKKKQKCS